MDDFRKMLVACYDLECRFNVVVSPEPACVLKLIEIGEGGKCKSRRPKEEKG